MSSENNDGGVSFALPGEVDDWLAQAADRRDESRDDICRHLVTAAHAVATDDDLETGDLEDIAPFQAQLDAQREEFIDLLEDVRGRVIQVKRETDTKAPADHDHDEYAGDDDLESLQSALTDLESTVDEGFDNFEAILEHLFEEQAAIEERTTLLAKAVVELRAQRDAAAGRAQRRAAADHLKRGANQLGIRSAVCDACNARVDIGLLTEPECPHCERDVRDVAEKSSLFGSPTLVTGDPPALEGAVANATGGTDTASEEVFEAVEADATTDGSETDESRSEANSRSLFEFETEQSIR